MDAETFRQIKELRELGMTSYKKGDISITFDAPQVDPTDFMKSLAEEKEPPLNEDGQVSDEVLFYSAS